MSIRARLDRLTQATGRGKHAGGIPPYDVAALRLLPPEELLRMHRAALADGDAPDPRAVAELRGLPPEQLLERHRRALGYAI